MASFNHNNRICIVCHKPYKYCGSCKEFAKLEPWYAMFHNENCKKLFDITDDLKYGNINERQAKEAFDSCDLSYKDQLHKNILMAIEKANNAVDKNDKDINGEQPIKKKIFNK